jgi:alpha-acetolactate decarboxylase
MLSQEYPLNTDITNTSIGIFTPEEAQQLARMREGYYQHVEYLERVIDERRLEFARWLVEQGRLSEALS